MANEENIPINYPILWSIHESIKWLNKSLLPASPSDSCVARLWIRAERVADCGCVERVCADGGYCAPRLILDAGGLSLAHTLPLLTRTRRYSPRARLLLFFFSLFIIPMHIVSLSMNTMWFLLWPTVFSSLTSLGFFKRAPLSQMCYKRLCKGSFWPGVAHMIVKIKILKRFLLWENDSFIQ